MSISNPSPFLLKTNCAFSQLARALTAILLLAVTPLAAVAQTAVPEKSKSEAVMRIMRLHTFFTPPKVLPFCRVFLDDFREQKEIRYVEPIIRAGSYDDPVLEPYKNRCPDLEMNKLAECPGELWSYLQPLSEEDREQEMDRLCSVYYGTKNFKLYELDLNRNPKDGKEVILYFERIFGPKRSDNKVYGNGGYSIFDMKSCKRRPVTKTRDPYDYVFNQPRENYNALIQYKSKYYIFDLYELGSAKNRDPNKLEYWLHLEGNRKDRWGGLCSFSTVSRSSDAKGETK